MSSASVILLSVLVLSTTAAEMGSKCYLYNSLLSDFEFDYGKFAGEWNILSSDIMNQKYKCWVDNFEVSGDRKVVISYFTDAEGKRQSVKGDVQLFGNKYTIKYPELGVSGQYAVLAVDYDYYAIIEGCTDAHESFLFVQYRDEKAYNEKKDEVDSLFSSELYIDTRNLTCICNC